MLGKKFYKKDFNNVETQKAYAECAQWCNDSSKGFIAERADYYECIAYVPNEFTKEECIEQLKAELATYDYIGIKIAMGVATKEEYADKIAYTETLRAKINELQN